MIPKPLLYLAATLLVMADQPRWQSPAQWNARLMPDGWGSLVMERDGNIELRYISARLSQTPLEVVPYSWFSENRPDTAPISSLVERYRSQTRRSVVAAVNGGFFDVKSRLPIGFLLREGNMEFFNMPQGFRRSMVGFTAPDAAGRTRVVMASPKEMPKAWLDAASPARGGTITSLPIHHINVPGGRDAFSVFTPTFGQTLSGIPGGIYFTAQAQGSWYTISSEQQTGDLVSIPRKGLVIALFGGSRAYASALRPGTRVRPRWTLPASWSDQHVRHGLLAGPRLLEHGAIRVSAAAEGLSKLHSRDRMVLGSKGDGQVVLMWLHREKGGGSIGFEEAARILAKRGILDAISLDGGSSRAVMATARQPYKEEEYLFAGRPIANALLLAFRDPA